MINRNLRNKNMEVNYLDKYGTQFSNINRDNLSELKKNFKNEKNYQMNKWKERSKLNSDSSRSTDSCNFRYLSESLPNSMVNSDLEPEFLKQNIYLYAQMVKKLINQFYRTLQHFKIKKKKTNLKYRSKNLSNQGSKKIMEIYLLIKIFKKFKKSSKFLLVSR